MVDYFLFTRDSVSTRKIRDSPMRVEGSLRASAVLQQPMKTRDEEADSLETHLCVSNLKVPRVLRNAESGFSPDQCAPHDWRILRPPYWVVMILVS
jgi:hypothetical protein